VLAIRSEKQSFFRIGLFSNKLLIGSVTFTVLLQAAIYIPFLQSVFKTQALTLTEFVLVGIASILIFAAVEIEKIVKRKKQSN
ncbi:MAG TPA: cation-translocating P-type ATPase C-terminal domain-containing protein, partial [Chitinophagaceae bacterium]|nr:cation-translocating P-type ATPase C-terminal domain-containing protein [Chitinophagaceae bacterium]